MNEQNLDYLKNSLDYLGFGTKLNDVLESAISRELPAFTLGVNQNYKPVGIKPNSATMADQVTFKLNFNRSKQSDMYFLNDYEITLNKPGNAVPIRQVFDLERDNRITALQAYKLLSGNALERDILIKAENGETPDKKKVWFKLNLDVQDAYGNHPLKKFYPEFKFDLTSAIDKYPFKGLNDLGKQGMERLLRNGNLAAAEMVIGKKAVPVFITANPQFKGLDVYDKNMSLIRQGEIFPKKEEGISQDKSSDKASSKQADIGKEQSEDRFPWENGSDQEQDQQTEIGR